MSLIDADALKGVIETYRPALIYDVKTDTKNEMVDFFLDEIDGVETEYIWHPIRQRPGTDEEYEEYSKFGDCPREEFKVYEGPLPEDGEEVFITTKWGDTTLDTWRVDVDWCGFEYHDDPDDVIAWMPKPKGYVPEDKR